MKKIILPILLIIFAISACTKQAGHVNGNQLIVGTWYYTNDTTKSYRNGVLQSTVTNLIVNDRTNYAKYNSGGTGAALVLGFSNTFTWSIGGNILTLATPAVTVSGLVIPATNQAWTIKSLTATNMVIYYSDTSKDSSGNTILDTEVAYLSK